jgi:CRISPR-associated endonuclease Cas1
MTIAGRVLTDCQPQRGVLVLAGYGIRMAVERGHLLVEDGLGRDRRRGRFARIGSGIERVIVLGHSGSVTLEALRWLHEIGAAFVQVGRDAELIVTGAPRVLSDVKLRRAQALAMGTEAGLPIARSLIREKIAGQARVVDQIAGHRVVRQALADAEGMLTDAHSLDHVRFIESRAAAAYWSAWEGMPLHFAGRDAKRVPSHWRTFGTRRSPLSSAPRKAATPANALLNYLYTILEAETRLAALAVGCDPALGILHVDKPGRDSLACDLMEPIRPRVDEYVLGLLASQTFERSDFFESRDGNCRLMPAMSRPLATTAPRWARDVAPVAEWIGGAFRRIDVSNAMPSRAAMKPVGRYRTPLTGSNRGPRSAPAHESVALALPSRCRTCGCDLGRRKRVYCEACLPDAAREAAAKGTVMQRQLRAIGEDARSSEATRARHRTNAVSQATAQRDWEAQQRSVPSRATFHADLAPLLAATPVEMLVEATGLSRQSCVRMRSGRSIPHPRHWSTLRLVAERYAKEHSGELKVPIDSAFFAREIAPHLKDIGAGAIGAATGLSASYSRRVLHGHHVPHPRHWRALLKLVQDKRLASARK